MSISACIKVVYCRAMLLLLLLGVAGLQAEVGVAQATSSRAAVGVLSANEFSGSTAGEQIQAALAALPPGGGLVDARGLGPGKKIISSTIKISAGQTLLLNPATELQPASPQMTMVSVAAGATLKGGDFDTTNQPSFDGKVISLTGNYEVRSSVGSARTHTLISDIKINGGRGGDGVYIAGTSTASQSAAFVVFSDLSVEGMGNCIHLYAAGSGWVNGNLFVNVTCAYSGVGVNMDVASGGVIEANQFVNFGFQYGVNESTAGIMLTGTGLIRYNLFSQAVIWDTVRVPPILISAATHGTIKALSSGSPPPVQSPQLIGNKKCRVAIAPCNVQPPENGALFKGCLQATKPGQVRDVLPEFADRIPPIIPDQRESLHALRDRSNHRWIFGSSANEIRLGAQSPHPPQQQ